MPPLDTANLIAGVKKVHESLSRYLASDPSSEGGQVEYQNALESINYLVENIRKFTLRVQSEQDKEAFKRLKSVSRKCQGTDPLDAATVKQWLQVNHGLGQIKSRISFQLDQPMTEEVTRKRVKAIKGFLDDLVRSASN